MATTTTKVKINGKVVEASNASLSPITFKAYWADTNGIRIDKIPFGSKVRFYIERWWAYNAKLKIYIKSGVKEAPIVEETIDKLIDGYFTKRELYYEMTLKKLSQFQSLQGANDFELCCDVVNGLSSFGEMREVAKIKATSPSIIFPLLIKPTNDTGNILKKYYWAASQGSNQATYMSNRSNKRKHGARDLYTPPKTTIVAIADGVVINTGGFYAGTNQISIKHKTIDGKEFIIRYGELDPLSITVAKGSRIEQGQILGVTGKLVGITVVPGHIVYMLHFEYFVNSVSQLPLTDKNNLPTQRRSDLKDPLEILQEGYNNTFL